MSARTDHGLPGIHNATPLSLPDGAGAALGLDSAGNLKVAVTAITPNYTNVSGQAAVATPGTAVAISAVNYVLQNGLVITPNNGNVSTGLTVGFTSGLTDVTNGTGNGIVVYPGGSTGIPSGVNMNSIFINSTATDSVSFAGN